MLTLASHLNMTLRSLLYMKFVMHPYTVNVGVSVVEKYSSGVSPGQAGTEKNPRFLTIGRHKTWLVPALQGQGRGQTMFNSHNCA